MVGMAAALITLVLIKVYRPYIFEGRTDRVVEQCTKTGLAAFSFALLISLARDRQSRE